MILTQENINKALSKVKWMIAKKTFKFACNIAIGKLNKCLLKEIKLLKIYKEILKKFKIVDSDNTCLCTLIGDYTFLLNSEASETSSLIQFSEDYSGYLVFNGTGYPFNYIYDSDNQTLTLTFSQFYDPGSPASRIIPTNQYILPWNPSDTNGQFSVTTGSEILYLDESPVAYTSFNQIVNAFNGATDTNLGYRLSYIGNIFRLTAPEGSGSEHNEELYYVGFAYENHPAIEEGVTLIGGIDPVLQDYSLELQELNFDINCNINLTNSLSPLEVGIIQVNSTPTELSNGTIEVKNNLGITIYNLAIPEEIIYDPIAIKNLWNQTNGESGWLLSYSDNIYTLTSPFNSSNYSNYTFKMTRTENTFPIVYQSTIGIEGDINLFSNTNPCNNEEILKTCLTNKQVISIINHIENLNKK